MDKHINFFEFQKAAEKSGCPLCRIVAKRTEQYIDNTLYEHISDRGFRAKHREAGGFCSWHSRGFESFKDGLAIAILGRDALEERIKTFEKHKPWAPKGRCPVCMEKDLVEEEYLDFFASAKGADKEEEEFRKIFCASDGLCAPHYASLLFTPKGKKRRLPSWLKEFHENKFYELKRRVDKFIELSAYGRQAEFSQLSEKDKLVWKELAAALRSGE